MSSESILHLNTVTLALCIAYLGLDKAHVEVDHIEEGLQQSKAVATKLLVRFDVQNGIQRRDGLFNRFPFFIKLRFFALCDVADVAIRKNGMFAIHAISREFYFPFLTYFKRRNDKRAVMICSLICFLGLIYSSTVSIWNVVWFIDDDIRFVHSEELEHGLFFMYVGISMWVIVTALLARRLKRMPNTCEKLSNMIEGHMNKLFDDVRRWEDEGNLT